MRLLVDEDSQARTLVRLLVTAGHDVLTAAEAGLNSLTDAEVLARAVAEGWVLLTRNGADFLAMHRQGGAHRGILAVYQDADPARDMTYDDIVRAIGNVERSAAQDGAFVILNAWKW